MLGALLVAATVGAGCAHRALKVAERPWVEVKTARVRLLGDVDPAVLVRLGRDLELFHHYLIHAGVARWPERTAPVTIVVVGRNSTYGAFRLAPGIVGWFVPTIRASYAVVNLDAGFEADGIDQNVLFHEFAHFLLAYNQSFRYPLWYEEGFAESLSTFRVDEAGGVDVGLPSEARIRELAEDWRPLRELFEERPIWYPQAWMTVHYLSSTPGRYDQLMKYLALYDAGATSNEAFEQAFDLDYRKLQAEIRKYYWRGEYAYLHFEPGELPAVESPVVRELAEGEILVELGTLFLDARREIDVARSLFERALEVDPTSAPARSGLAAAALASGELATAALQADAALAADSRDARGHTLRGHCLVERLESDDEASVSSRAALREEARAEYLRAIELAPDVPEPYWALARIDRDGSDSSDPAIRLLETGRSLQPLDPRIPIDLAAIRIERRELAKARLLLEPLVREHEGPLGAEARALLRKLEQAERSDGLAR